MPVTITAARYNWVVGDLSVKLSLDLCQCPRVPVRQRCACQLQSLGTRVANLKIGIITGIALIKYWILRRRADLICCDPREIAVAYRIWYTRT